MRGSTKIIKKKEMESILGRMAPAIKDLLSMISSIFQYI